MAHGHDDASAKSLVIFGGGSGIGLATATLAVAVGWSVVIADKDPVAAALPIVVSGGALFASCDATAPAQVAEVLGQIVRRHGRLDGVATTIGGAYVRPELSLDLDYWRREIEFNLTTAYIVAMSALAIMTPARAGSIVTMSSSYGDVPAPDRIGYAAAKAGVIGLTKSLAAGTAGAGIRINCVAPGATDTPRLRRMTGGPDDFAKLGKAAPQGRIATPPDVAEAVLFLLSDAARSITGQVIYVNNGSYMP